MYENQNVVNSLSDKVEDLLKRFQQIRENNEALRQEIVSLKAQNEAKDIQINKLHDELKFKDLESEDILEKIEAVIGNRWENSP